MQLPQLTTGVLIKRYKRFLADIDFGGGVYETVHCPNPGAMTGLKTPGARVWCSTSDSKIRKLPKTLELVEADGGLVGINTNLPNRLMLEALQAGKIPSLRGFPVIAPESTYEKGTRFDFKLTREDSDDAMFVEVKNVHLRRENGLAEFPDSVTARGTKHLEKLAEIARGGGLAAMVYVIQRTDCDRFALARDIDPAYGAAFDAAREAGVMAEAWSCAISPAAITIERPVKMV